MVRERVQKALISMCKILQSSIVAHVHPVQTCDLTNRLVQKLVSLVVVSVARHVKARSKLQNLLPL